MEGNCHVSRARPISVLAFVPHSFTVANVNHADGWSIEHTQTEKVKLVLTGVGRVGKGDHFMT